MSSNQFLKESGARALEPGTVVLAVSQSGQDFPTLAALYQLRQHFGEAGHGRLFVLTGEADTLMGQAVGQSFAGKALWLGRILTNCAGYRPSEAATASVNATHAALCELLYVTCETAMEHPPPHHGLMLDDADRRVLRARGDACVDRHVGAIVSGGADARAAGAPEIARRIGQTGRRFSHHLLEGIIAFVLAGLVLEANLALGLQVRPSWFTALLPDAAPELLTRLVAGLGAQADVLYYLFLTPLFVWLLRLLQRRPGLHRQGMRELLIGDTGYVRQIVWLLTRKLFGLSYGFATIKPYAADNQDDLIMTHEPVRGTLALFGVPDGRRAHLRRARGRGVDDCDAVREQPQRRRRGRRGHHRRPRADEPGRLRAPGAAQRRGGRARPRARSADRRHVRLVGAHARHAVADGARRRDRLGGAPAGLRFVAHQGPGVRADHGVAGRPPASWAAAAWSRRCCASRASASRSRSWRGERDSPPPSWSRRQSPQRHPRRQKLSAPDQSEPSKGSEPAAMGSDGQSPSRLYALLRPLGLAARPVHRIPPAVLRELRGHRLAQIDSRPIAQQQQRDSHVPYLIDDPFPRRALLPRVRVRRVARDPAILRDQLADLGREQHHEVLGVVELRPVALGDELAQIRDQPLDVRHSRSARSGSTKS